MFKLFLQITGGLFYFSNKLFFAAAEREKNEVLRKKWQTAAWLVYLSGVSPWVIIFVYEHNWIAAAVESSGVPAMLLGLINVLQKKKYSSLSRVFDIFSKIMIITGLCISFYDFGGIASFNQLIELWIAAGFLFGTYYIAKSKAAGYVWLIIGNISAALLMFRQEYYILMLQQLFSIIPVSYALVSYHKRERSRSSNIRD